MSDRIVLYDNAFSPYAFKIRATLYEKGIEHDQVEMRHASQREALLEINPRGEVPALVHGDARIYDSSVICEYLETGFPEPPLLPRDAEGQARCRLFERMADGPLDGCLIALAIVKLFRPKLGAEHPEIVERALAEVENFYRHLDQELAGRDFLCGDFSRADIAFAPQLAGAGFMGAPPVGEHLAAWHERVAARPSIQRATAEFMASFQNSQQDPDPFFSRDHLHVRDHRLEWCFRLGLGPWLVSELEAERLAFSPVL